MRDREVCRVERENKSQPHGTTVLVETRAGTLLLLVLAATGLSLVAGRHLSHGQSQMAQPVRRADVRVHVTLRDTDGREVPAAEAVVWLPGSSGVSPAPAEEQKITQRNKRFEPRVVTIGEGESVAFPNVDPINHNVFSDSAIKKFDLGLYRNGDSREQSFPQPGIVPIYCNIHPNMVAYVAVVDGEIRAKTGYDGNATLPSVPAGTHDVRIWHERGHEWKGTIQVPEEGPPALLKVVLEVTSWRDVPHKRKDGSDYPPPDDDENRY